MTVNQKIKKLLKRGDMARLAEILGISHAAIRDRLSSDKEIDSVDFINAVVKVTGKPFEYFKPVEGGKSDMHVSHVSEPTPLYKKFNITEQDVELEGLRNAALYWKEKYDDAQKHIQELKDNIETKNKLIEQMEIRLKRTGQPET